MKDLIQRFRILLIKIVSVKGLILGLATWLIMFEKIGPEHWMICALGLAGIRGYEKAHGLILGPDKK